MQLLNCPNYLIQPRFDPQKQVDTYEIRDSVTGSLIGSAREIEPQAWLKLLRWVWGRNLFRCTVHVCEHGSAAPLFSMREFRGFWSPRLQVVYETGHVLCWFRPKFAVLGGGFTVHDAAGALLAQLESPEGGTDYRFVARNGREIGTIIQRTLPAGKLSECAHSYLVLVKERDNVQGLGGLLLLAAALSLDLVYRERI